MEKSSSLNNEARAENISSYEQDDMSVEQNEEQNAFSDVFNWINVLEKLKEKSNPQVSFWFSSLSYIGNENNKISESIIKKELMPSLRNN